jgi:hypothetical protein
MQEHTDAFFPRNRSRFELNAELSRLHWTEVERLCETILRRMHGGAEVLGLNRAGAPGADGVDFVVTLPDGHIAYQVKANASMTSTRLRAWVDEFARGRWRERCGEFVIVSAFRPSPALQGEYLALKHHLLEEHGVRFRLEDPGWFDERLREFPDIAGRTFGPDAQLLYEDRVTMARAEQESTRQRASAFRSFELTEYGVRCGDVGLHLDCYLPDQRDRSLSAALRFIEAGAYDVTWSLGNDDMLAAFEEAEWRDGFPFYTASSKNVDYLQVGNGRVGVPRSTTQALADAIRFVRDAWHERVRAVDEAREAVGYQYVHRFDAVKIGRIEPALWRATLEFANAHAHDAGDGPFNVFFDHPALLQIFTTKRGSMRAGHHAQLRTLPLLEPHEPLPHAYLDVLWTMPPLLFDDCREFSREAWWPVNMVARWFDEELLPAVWAWCHRDRRTRWDKLRRVPHAVPAFVPGNWWYAVRAPLLERRRPSDRESLRQLLTDLQRHYALRTGTMPDDYTTWADVALLRLLERADLEHWGYVQSKGEFSGTTREEMVAEVRARIDGSSESLSAFGLEWRLRTFVEIIANSGGHIGTADVEAVALALAPLCREADRYNERLAHRIEPADVFPK